eukprot:183477_1
MEVNHQQLMWFSWDPYGVDTGEKKFSFGVVSADLNDSSIASLDIYGDQGVRSSAHLDYVTVMPPTVPSLTFTISPVQLDAPKICLSQVGESNKMDFGNEWIDDCNSIGWERTRKAHIVDDHMTMDGNESLVDECQITSLNTKVATECFLGPFKGTGPAEYGDYVSRFFYVFSHVDFDVIEVNLDYHSLCTWNPEQFENDTAYVFVNHQASWKSAPQYEFVHEYCQGYSLYSDWSLELQYQEILSPDLIQCLTLLDQICTYPVQFTFRYTDEDDLYFNIGIGAQLNQKITNEAFGFSHVSVRYVKCPAISPLLIGDITDLPYSILDNAFKEGDMFMMSADSMYYLIVNALCEFTLFGGYKMWSQKSANCTIAGLPIMQNISSATLSINIFGYLSGSDVNGQDTLWSRRTPCDKDDAYFYYSMNKTNKLTTEHQSIYSIDCQWSLTIAAKEPIIVTNPGGEKAWSKGSNVESLVFDGDGSLVVNDVNGSVEVLSPKGAEFLIFDEGKLALMDHDEHTIIKQIDFEYADCTGALDESTGVIKYFYLMKP